ncbi:hypothetical protein SGFS_011780 [Streptomyces graminofaciens]|uniref:Uncharacterized protein n=1 Tax=Streptomyces graminofaciens TaxID=68212 RepID=A0ABM7F268_9ACTN|nr:hypothetical protein SGFS_011780 [Streptomyces graminofaciens]
MPSVLTQAAPAAGLTAVGVCAARRAASGFAHGRYRPNLPATQPRAGAAADNGVHTIALVIDEGRHRPSAEHCHTLLQRRQDRHLARARSPRTPAGGGAAGGFRAGHGAGRAQ